MNILEIKNYVDNYNWFDTTVDKVCNVFSLIYLVRGCRKGKTMCKFRTSDLGCNELNILWRFPV